MGDSFSSLLNWINEYGIVIVEILVNTHAAKEWG